MSHKHHWLNSTCNDKLPVFDAKDMLPSTPRMRKRTTPIRTPRTPNKNKSYLRMGAAAIAVMLAVHVCSALFTGVSLLGYSSTDLSDLKDLIGNGVPASAGHYSSEPEDVPKLIPRIIHQTYRTRQLPDVVKKYMQTWKDMNPGWEVRFYDDQDCLEFVKREFPEYLTAYKRLERNVERSDFFRYMVVLRYGGVYADIDTECRQPMDSIIRSKDTLIVGWENEFPTPLIAVEGWYARTRQVLQWVFMGAPGHPALKETCDRIAASVRTTFSSDPNMDVLEKTGPGVFTDVVLEHSKLHPPANSQDPWSVRILPRVSFGAPRKPAFGLTPRGDGVAVQHAYLGSWRLEHRWWLFWRRPSVEEMANRVSRWWKYSSDTVISEQVARLMPRHDPRALYPVSADFDPPFDIMTHLTSHGERHSGWDVSSALSTHGAWQPSVQPYRRPSLAEALVGSLGAPSSKDAGRAGVLVDIGAGYGFVALAAAARGHRVHAFELGPRSLDALEASVERNGFGHLVDIHRVPLGAADQNQPVCLERRQVDGTPTSKIVSDVNRMNNDGAVNTATSASTSGTSTATAVAAVVSSSSEEQPPTEQEMELSRGYASPEQHEVDDRCTLSVPRLAGTDVLSAAGERVGAIRISANGWEGWIIDGLAPLIEKQRPPVISVEWNPSLLKQRGFNNPLQLIERLNDLGYTDVSHSGFVCDERWYAITYGIRRRGGVLPEELAALKQPTWCKLTPEDWRLLLDRASGTYPETLLFVNKGYGGSEKREDIEHVSDVNHRASTRKASTSEQQPQSQQQRHVGSDDDGSYAHHHQQQQERQEMKGSSSTHGSSVHISSSSSTSTSSALFNAAAKLGRKAALVGSGGSGSGVDSSSRTASTARQQQQHALVTDPVAGSTARDVSDLAARERSLKNDADSGAAHGRTHSSKQKAVTLTSLPQF